MSEVVKANALQMAREDNVTGACMPLPFVLVKAEAYCMFISGSSAADAADHYEKAIAEIREGQQPKNG